MKKISKITLMTLLCLLSLLFVAPGFSISASAATPPEEETATPQADVLEWIYDQRGTSVYKRLYNTSTHNWVGDWIYVGETPGKGEPVIGKH